MVENCELPIVSHDLLLEPHDSCFIIRIMFLEILQAMSSYESTLVRLKNSVQPFAVHNCDAEASFCSEQLSVAGTE